MALSGSWKAPQQLKKLCSTAIMVCGDGCAVTPGLLKLPQWLVGSWDCQLLVGYIDTLESVVYKTHPIYQVSFSILTTSLSLMMVLST